MGKWCIQTGYPPYGSVNFHVFIAVCSLNDVCWGPVHTKPKKIENAASFLRLGLPSTLIRHEKGSFRKRSSNRRNLKTLALRFSVDGKRFEYDDITMIMWFSCPSFPETQIQNDRCLLLFQVSPAKCERDTFQWRVSKVKTPFSNFSYVVWTENIWCVSRMKTPFSNFSCVV